MIKLITQMQIKIKKSILSSKFEFFQELVISLNYNYCDIEELMVMIYLRIP